MGEWVEGSGKVPAELMVVGEAPGKDEVSKGKVFVGATGAELDNLLKKVGLVWRDDVYCTNISKVPLDSKKKISPDEMEVYGELLSEEIEKVNPRVIMALGAVSSHWFLGGTYDMETLNAVPHEWNGRIVIPSIHPAAAFHDTSLFVWVVQSMMKVRDALTDPGSIRREIRERNEVKPVKICSIEKSLCGDIIAIDTETTSDGNLFMISVSSREGVAGVTLASNRKAIRMIREAVGDGVTVILHNALYDLPQLEQVGIKPRKFIDTMQMAFLIQTLPLGLKNLTYKLTGLKAKEYEEVVGKERSLEDVAEEEAFLYSAQDADSTLRVYNAMKPLVYDRMGEVLERDHAIIPMLIDMMKTGMRVDIGHFERLYVEFMERNERLREKIEKYAWPGFNPASAPQNSKLLYEKLKLGRRAKITKTKWGGSTDKKNIKKIIAEHPVVSMIEEWKARDTLMDKYLAVLPRAVGSDGRIHTKLSLVRVKHSGRLASSNPNLMAQPVRSEEGLEIRNGFVATPGYKLVSFDYNQIEMRMMAHLSKDEAMIRAYLSGADIHTETAMKMFGIADPKDVDEMKHRYPAKRVGFGVINLITAHGLERELAEQGAGMWGRDACQEMLDAWFRMYPGVRRFFDEIRRKVIRDCYVEDMWGRREWVWEVKSVHAHIREAGIRKAINQQIQSGAQGVIKEAMRRVWEWAEEVNKRWWELRETTAIRPLLQIHDSLEMEIIEWEGIGDMISKIKTIMEGTVKLRVPVVVGVKWGDRWGSLKEWKG